MARPAYSSQIVAEHALFGAVTFTVPGGALLVVRDVDVWIAAPILSSVEYRMLGSEGQTIDWAVCDADTTILHQWRGRQVLEAGQTLTLTASDHADVSVSGYLLTA